MFLKNNKYKDVVIASMYIIFLALLGFKLFGYLDDIVGIANKIVSLSMSFIYGIIIAYILNPVVKIIQSKFKTKRTTSILGTYIIVLCIISLICIFFVPSLIKNIKDIINKAPEYIDLAEKFIYNIAGNEQVNGIINSTELFNAIQSYIDKLGVIVMSIVEGSFNTIFLLSSHIIKLILGFLVSIYVLVDKDRLIKDWKRLLILILKEEKANKIIEFGRVYHKMIGTYIGIKAIDSSIIGGMAFVLLTLVKSEYALLLSIIVGFTNMIPYFGPFIGEIVGFLINVFVSPIKGLAVFFVLFSLQMFDGWYLDPKLIGEKVGVRPFWIIYAVVIGGGFFGPIGMLLASPTAATIKLYYQKILDRKKELLKSIE